MWPAATPRTGAPGGQIALDSAEPVSCPEASILGSAKIVTPLLEDPLEGSIYLAQPYEKSLLSARPNTGWVAARAVPGGGRRRDADQARGESAGRSQHGPGDGQLGEPAAAPDRRNAVELLRWRTGAARHTAGMRRLRSAEHADPVERHARRGGVLEPRDRLGTERRSVPERRIRPVVHGGHRQQPGGRVERVLADAHAPGRRAALRRLLGDAATGDVRDLEERRAMPGTAGIERGMPAGIGNRHDDGGRGTGSGPVLPTRAGPAGEQGVPDGSRPLGGTSNPSGRALWLEHRRAGDRGAVRPRQRGHAREGRGRPAHRATDDLQRAVAAQASSRASRSTSARSA